jgi:hypothetical protein
MNECHIWDQVCNGIAYGYSKSSASGSLIDESGVSRQFYLATATSLENLRM